MNRANARWSIIAEKRKMIQERNEGRRDYEKNRDFVAHMLSEAMRLEDDDYTGQQAN